VNSFLASVLSKAIEQKSDVKSQFSGEIRVAAKIIDYISSGLYHSPAACLKELINNSYDADARNVNVFVKPDANRIIIEDDGVGMTKEEFVNHFSKISESHKRDSRDVTDKGRKKIGKIGIGFIAANEVCDEMELFSTKAGSTDLLHVTINFAELREPPEQRTREAGSIAKADYVGEILTAKKEESYTRLFLNKVRGESRQLLAGAKPQAENKEAKSLYGLNEEEIVKVLKSSDLNTWKDFDSYSETFLQIGLNVPVRYYEGWLPKKLRNKVAFIENRINALDFSVFYDGSPLCKPIVFTPGEESRLEIFEYNGDRVSAQGYFIITHGAIKPIELQGVLIRIREAAVGEFDPSFMGFSASEYQIIQRWLSAEIWSSDELEDAMNIDRRTLRIAHPAYVELREELHRQFRSMFLLAKKEIYEKGNIKRSSNRLKEDVKSLRQTANRQSEATPMAATVLRTFANTINKEKPRVLNKKYSATQVLDLVSKAASGIIADNKLQTLLERLVSLLSGRE
jgi:hypothetical protein